MRAGPIDDLIVHLSRLPGIGERTATRLAFYLLRTQPSYRENLSRALSRLNEIVLCSNCRTVTEKSPCAICQSHVRRAHQICVVEKPSDIYAIERLQIFHGTYFVLHGLLSPMEGIGPKDIALDAFFQKIEQEQIEELILALSPTVEGDATVSYIVKFLADRPLKVSRLASGLPMGSELEYADRITLGKAFEARTLVR